MSALLAGWLLGIAGSLHCVGMCGPLAVLAPVDRRSSFHMILSMTAYQLGRTAMYALLGLLIGLFGRGLAIGGWQQGIAFVAGLGTIGWALRLLYRRWRIAHPTGNTRRITPDGLNPTGSTRGVVPDGYKKAAVVQHSFIPSPVKFIHKASGVLLRRPARWYNALGFGAVNGLLPCGMVYLALVASVAANSAAGSTVFMAGFGLGTIPTMLLAALGLQWVRAHAGHLYVKYFPFVILLTGLILVLRSASAMPDLLQKIAVHCMPQ